MIRKELTLIILALALTISACGSQPVEEKADSAAETSTLETQIDAAEDQEEKDDRASEATSEEVEKSVPWYIEHNIEFTNEREFQMPYYSYIKFADNVNNTEYECDQNIATYNLDEIQVDDLGDGYLSYTLSYTVNCKWRGIFSNEAVAGDFSPSMQQMAIFPMDKYTGEVYPEKRLDSHIDKGMFVGDEISHSIDWDGQSYEISHHVTEESKELSYYYTNYDSQRDLYEDELVFYRSIVVRAPKEYDGLIFMLRKEGVSEYKEMPEEIPEHSFERSYDEEYDSAYFFSTEGNELNTEHYESDGAQSEKEFTDLPADKMTILTISAWIDEIKLENEVLTIKASNFMDATDYANTNDIEGMDNLSIAVRDTIDFYIYYVESDSSDPIEPVKCSFEELKQELADNEKANLRIFVNNGKASQVTISVIK